MARSASVLGERGLVYLYDDVISSGLKVQDY